MQIDRGFRLTIIWQLVVTVAIAVVAGMLVGRGGFLSAVLGGGIGLIGVWVFALMSRRRAAGSGDVVRTVVRAEAAKVIAIVLLLWLVFTAYRDLVVLAFFGAFMVSVLLSGIAFAVSGD
jgi:F0F1-type ATP synthase assembly protein I